MEWTRGRYRILDDPDRLDFELIHGFLAGSYGARGIPRPLVERSSRNCLPFGLYDGPEQVGFAEVVTDRATFASIADVFVLEPHRGRGLALWLMGTIRSHPDLQDLRRWMLATSDAHGLYGRIGFRPLEDHERYMEIVDRKVYERA